MILRRDLTAIAALIGVLLSAVPAPAAPVGAGSISGTIVDRSSSLPITHAIIEVERGTTKVATGRSDAAGVYRIAKIPQGPYSVLVQATRYQTITFQNVIVTASSNTLVNAAMDLARLGTIAVVHAGAGAGSLQTSTVISQNVPVVQVQQQNYNRIGDALLTLPGVNVDSQSSAMGDDIFIDIRGVGPTETQTLIDGHPVGPIGVAPATFFNGAPTAFDYQVTPYFAFRDVRVTYGSGATGLYGTDSIGGVVDLQTLDPTTTPHAEFVGGIGTAGKSTVVYKATGTAGRLGYALLTSQQDLYGNFPLQTIPQTGNLGTNLTSANVNAYTWPVSANYRLRSSLGKLTYQLSPATSFEATGYVGTSWDDKSGNGDNDFYTYSQQLYNAQQALAGNSNQTSVTGTNGKTFTCTGAIAVINDSHPNGTCYGVTQWAQAAYGPAGGGPFPWQAILNQDYHARFSTHPAPNNQVIVDAFNDNYSVDYNRSCGSTILPDGNCVGGGGYDTTFTRTFGFLASDDITSERNDLGFGTFFANQNITGNTYSVGAPASVENQPLHFVESSYFLRDQYIFSPKLSGFFNGWLRHSTLTQQTTFDPRLSLIYRATGNDVFRATAGHATGNPAAPLVLGVFTPNGTPQNINFVCGPGQITAVGTIGNTALKPESGTDLELGYGHRFGSLSTLEVDAYTTNLSNQLFEAQVPATPYASLFNPTLLNEILGAYSSHCAGGKYTINNLAVNQVVNASRARFQGIEVKGNVSVTPEFSIDYTYDIQSAVRLGVTDQYLMSNYQIINGSQILGIPLHKWALGFDLRNKYGFEGRLDTYWIAENNGYNRPAYFFGNLSLSQAINDRLALNFGVQNVFNNASDIYGRIGYGVFQPQNQFGTAASALSQSSEQFGLPPASIQLLLTAKM